jgi:hypothetical protein
MTRYCFSCQFMPSSRCVHQQGIQAATPFTPACPLFKPQAAPTDPLTPAERAELTALEGRHPMALMDAWALKRLTELRQKAAGR